MKIIKFLMLSIVLFITKGNAQEFNFNLSQKEWIEDVEFLKKQVQKTVPLYDIPIRQQAFDSIYNIIMDNDIGVLKEDKIFALQRLLNTLEDEGCNVTLFQSGLGLEILPIKTYWFEDGLYIVNAADAFSSYIGKQIARINQKPVEDVFNRLKFIINADNDYYKTYLFQAYGFMPLALKAMGLGNSETTIGVQFSDGKETKFSANKIIEYGKLPRKLPNDSEFYYTNTIHKGENYWMETLPDTNTLFIQLKRVANSEDGESFSSFVDGIEDQIKDGKANKIILDVRYGGGGNGFKLKKLTDLLRESQGNQKGKLFVLTSRATRGTLLELASILRLNTKAVVIGQPTAEGPNTVGDTKYITLPNSGLNVSLTHTLWPTSWEQDDNTYLFPDVHITYQYADYKAHRDPWVEAVLDYKIENTNKPVPENLLSSLQGTYKVEGRKVTISSNKDRLFLSMNRKMKSFFEIHTELYHKSEGVLSSDIEGVTITYDSKELALKYLEWNGVPLKILK